MAIEARNNAVEPLDDFQPFPFIPPDDPEVKTWRYMDFTKFVSLLDTGSLFFCRISEFDDPFEGAYSLANASMRRRVYPEEHASIDEVSRLNRELREMIAVNCWYMGEHESAAMWNLYSKSSDAICIQSTYSKLRKCLPEIAKIGIVKYVDYTSEWIPERNRYSPYLYKRKSFEHEQEIRVIVDLSEHNELTMIDKGVLLKVDLESLIEKIYIAPLSAGWLKDLVVSIMKKYGIHKTPEPSDLEARPLY